MTGETSTRLSHRPLAETLFYFRQLIVSRLLAATYLQLSKRDFRMVVRHHHDVIAIEAFKRSYAQVQSGRLDPDEHRGTAIWARMKVNFVGREAKERVRDRHIALLRFNREVDPDRSRHKARNFTLLTDAHQARAFDRETRIRIMVFRSTRTREVTLDLSVSFHTLLPSMLSGTGHARLRLTAPRAS
jgi:hypothetical protein